MKKADMTLQAQVDAQLLEQGAFCPLELLFGSGRLFYEDYEAWRRGGMEYLDTALMGNPTKIRDELAQAATYARSIGLVEEAQEFFAWGGGEKVLRISSDPALRQLISRRYVPAQTAPQMDLFFDNPVVALVNGLTRALCAGNATEAQRQLDRLYVLAPQHADLAAFDRLLAALGHLNGAIEDARQELQFLLSVTPMAKRLLGTQARDLLAPLWRKLAAMPEAQKFFPNEPQLHRSFALSQAQDWAGVSECILREPQWQRHVPLCLLLAESGFYRRRRIEALTGWCQLCWHAPERAAQALEDRKQLNPEMTQLWQQFIESEEELAEESDEGEAALSAADFPVWLLLHEPVLAQLLPVDLAAGESRAEDAFRSVHKWTEVRRAGRQEEELALRKKLQVGHPVIFRLLKRSIAKRKG